MGFNLDIHAEASLVKEAKALALKGDTSTRISQPVDREDLKALLLTGSQIWLDTGDRNAAAKLWASQITGLTTNNTLANQVVQTGIMDEVIKTAATRIKSIKPNIKDEELVIEVGFVVNAKIARNLAFAFDAKVSVELHPAVAYDTEATILFAERYYDINPEQFFIKVPLTPEGLVAVRALEKKGIPVNLTLGFSARQNHLATRFANPSFVNIFLGRLNQVVKENGLGDGNNIGEKTTLASQIDVWEAKKKLGTKTKQIAASLRAGTQVPVLAGVDVQTIPPSAMEEFYNLRLKPADIKKNTDAKLDVKVKDGETPKSLGLNLLWEIDDPFRDMTEKLLKENCDKISGRDLVRFAIEHGVANLFKDYNESERAKIKADGKIPKIPDWREKQPALDDLMTISALESFAKDQSALDGRILKMIKG